MSLAKILYLKFTFIKTSKVLDLQTTVLYSKGIKSHNLYMRHVTIDFILIINRFYIKTYVVGANKIRNKKIIC